MATVADRPAGRLDGRGPFISELLSHSTQHLRDLPNRHLNPTLHVADTQKVRRFLLGWGEQVEVFQPIAIREELKQEAPALGRSWHGGGRAWRR